VNGTVEVSRDRIKIIRKGVMAFLSQGLKGDKEILLSQVSSVQLKRAGLLTNGYIQFAFAGGREAKRGIFEATQDENTVMFKASQQAAFLAIRSEIERLQRSGTRPAEAERVNLGDIEKLGVLRDKGLITQAEFDAKKRQILGL
jgi:hypothetical protein